MYQGRIIGIVTEIFAQGDQDMYAHSNREVCTRQSFSLTALEAGISPMQTALIVFLGMSDKLK